MLRITYWVMKATAKFHGKITKNGKESVKKELINGVDSSTAKNLWLQKVQKDLRRIKNFKNVSYQLDSFEDEDGLGRCDGRLAKSNLPYSYFLPKELFCNINCFEKP